MNKYAELKRLISNEQVITHLLGEPKKRTTTNLWYDSPFRKEKTPSLCVSNDKGIHDFGSSTHYDIISFVAELCKCKNSEAYKILCREFNLSLDDEHSKSEIEIYKHNRSIEEQAKKQVEEYYHNEMIKVCKRNIENEKLIDIFSKGSNFELLDILYKEQVLINVRFEYLADIKDKTKLFLEEKYYDKSRSRINNR